MRWNGNLILAAPRCGAASFRGSLGLWSNPYSRLLEAVKINIIVEKFESVLLDVELTLNNWPLTYLEYDIQTPVLTPSSLMMFSDCNFIQDENIDQIEETDEDVQTQSLEEVD